MQNRQHAEYQSALCCLEHEVGSEVKHEGVSSGVQSGTVRLGDGWHQCLLSNGRGIEHRVGDKVGGGGQGNNAECWNAKVVDLKCSLHTRFSFALVMRNARVPSPRGGQVGPTRMLHRNGSSASKPRMPAWWSTVSDWGAFPHRVVEPRCGDTIGKSVGNEERKLLKALHYGIVTGVLCYFFFVFFCRLRRLAGTEWKGTALVRSWWWWARLGLLV